MDEKGKRSPADKNSFVVRASNVPNAFLENREIAKKYFRRFGKVKLIMFKPKRQSLVIEYANEDGMLNALEVAGEFNGTFFNVDRYFETLSKTKHSKKSADAEWTVDPEVRSELEAMAGGVVAPRTYTLRSEVMDVTPVDASQVQSPKGKNKIWKSSSPKPTKKNLIVKESTISLNPDYDELLNLIHQPALSVEKKYRVLDARDKLLRLQLKHRAEMIKTSATIGTCPDMCPEKERLMRETQHQVALYEQEEGGRELNPRLAVKQYSRSSADQEAPLPSELRPVSVLQMTMGYLMHNIIGLCDTPDVNIAEWFHFLWDRTRGIRKDITQQELCCQGSVELVEQCARFHILCSARLVAEDPSVFDQKINTENLTKCLQTLKYMYHDLQLKGVSCENESEFRAYIILLNLNDGNFMWEVQQLEAQIQESKEVKFALQVYSSLDKKNYVKFFKLVASTTYLNACILMRYFMQVRLSALKILLKCYNRRAYLASIPIQLITRILAFESTEATTEFLETYGLNFNNERTDVVLDKHSFSSPEYPYVLERAINLIEAKRQSSIGEVVCGKHLPPKTYDNHTPQNSFDDKGYLTTITDLEGIEKPKSAPRITERKEKIHSFLKDETDSSSATPMFFTTPKPLEHGNKDCSFMELPPKPEPKQAITTKSLWSSPASNKIFGDFATTTTGYGDSSNATIFGDNSNQQPIFGSGIVPLLPPKPEENRAKIEEETALKKQEERRQELARLQEQQRILEQRLDAERKELERRRKEKELQDEENMRQMVLQEMEERKRRHQEAKNKELLRQKIAQEELKRQTLLIEIKNGVKATITYLLDKVEENVKRETLASILKRARRKRLLQIVRQWRELTRRRRKRKAIDFCPAWAGSRTIAEGANDLRTSSQQMTLRDIKRYKRGHPNEIPLPSLSTPAKIDLTALTSRFLATHSFKLDMKLRSELFWKITISIPNQSEYLHGLNHMEETLNSHIQWRERNGTTQLIERSQTVPVITYSLEKQKGEVNVRLGDSSGFIFIANDFNEALQRRIVNNLKVFGLFAKVPIVLVLQNYEDSKSSLKGLMQAGILSDYLIIVESFTAANVRSIMEEALVFLSTKLEKSPPLEMDALKAFLGKYLCDHVWKSATSFAKWNSHYKNCLKTPNTAIYLYNEALDRVKKILLNKACKEYSRFPQVFREFLHSEIPESLPCDYKYFPSFWDNASYGQHVEKLLNSLYLPNFLSDWPPRDELELELALSEYCGELFKEPVRCFHKIIGILLKDVDFEVRFDDVRNVLWTDIVEMIAGEKLEEADFSLYGTGFVNKSIYNQLVVVYDVNTLDSYIKSDWFYINNPVIKHKIQEELEVENRTEVIQQNGIFEADLEIDIDAIFDNLIKKPRSKNVDKFTSDIRECRMLLDDLEGSYVVHKKILEKSGDYLKNVVDNT